MAALIKPAAGQTAYAELASMSRTDTNAELRRLVVDVYGALDAD
jgi:hypothetical protein